MYKNYKKNRVDIYQNNTDCKQLQLLIMGMSSTVHIDNYTAELWVALCYGHIYHWSHIVTSILPKRY